MPKIAAIVNDLNVMTKIRNSADWFGLSVGFVESNEHLEYYLKDCDLILVDLENGYLEPLGLISQIKSNKATDAIKLIGFLSHINSPLKAQAMAAGCNEVVSRFEFNSNLKEILHATTH